MHQPDLLLRDLAVILSLAAVATVLFQRLRQPVVAGYLLTGVLVGPSTFGMVRDLETIETLTELGVILLMASLGLEFSFRTLIRLGPRVAVVALIEIGFMFFLGSTVGGLFGWSAGESLFLGGLLAISSTMIVAKVFDDRRPPKRLRELVLGILVMEDLAAVLLIVVLTAVAAGADLTLGAMAGTVARLALVLGGLMVAGVLLLPRAIRFTVRLRRSETTLVTAIGVIFLFALLTRMAGYSVALGAFIAGSVLHESGAAREIVERIRPVRDMFGAIFFVSVGMLVDPAVLVTLWPVILIVTAVVILGKSIGVSSGALLAGYPLRTAVHAGMTLTQIGEFSFIIAGLTLTATSPIGGHLFPVAVAVSVLTAFSTPFLYSRAESTACAIDERLPAPVQTATALYASWTERLRAAVAREAWRKGRRSVGFLVLDAIIIGALLIGTAEAFRLMAAPWASRLGLALPLARGLILLAGGALAIPFGVGLLASTRRLARVVAEAAFPVVEAGVDQALAARRTLTIMIEIGIVMTIGWPLVAVSQPVVPYGGLVVVGLLLTLLGVSLIRSASDLQEHAAAGAELVMHVLGRLGQPGHDDDFLRVQALLPGLGTVEPVRIHPNSPAADRTIGELNLRGLTGATIVAQIRGEERTVFPTGRSRLQPGDLVALSGSDDAVRAGRRLLEGEQVASIEYPPEVDAGY